MSRTYLTPEYDEYGEAITNIPTTWFDIHKAHEFKADTYWDGHNMCDVNTRSQWVHEVLYLTASGAWILNVWSQWEGSIPTYNKITDRKAAEWLLFNGYVSDPEEFDPKENGSDIPPPMLQLMAQVEAETEV